MSKYDYRNFGHFQGGEFIQTPEEKKAEDEYLAMRDKALVAYEEGEMVYVDGTPMRGEIYSVRMGKQASLYSPITNQWPRSRPRTRPKRSGTLWMNFTTAKP